MSMNKWKEIKEQHEAEQTRSGRQKVLTILGGNHAYARTNIHRGELIAMLEKIFQEADELGSLEIWRIDEIMFGEK